MIETFLSDEIYSLVQYFGTEIENNDKNKYITSDLFLNWNLVGTIFSDKSDNFCIHEQSDEWFNEKKPFIHVIMNEASINLLQCSPENISQLWERCCWTNRSKDIVTCYEYLLANDESKLLEALLVLTSVIERSLGDVYRINKDNVPFLLRDLLETEYLYSVLGKGPIRLMQMLFGTPRFLNIRNLAWHGFFSSHELNRNHVSILFIILAAIGNILTISQISPENVPYRSEVSNFNEKVTDIENRNTFVNIVHYDSQVKEILLNNDFIGPTHLPYWNKILEYASEIRNSNCLVLFLPQFEHLLRRIFCKLNNCTERTMTAIETEKYTTLDDIFAVNIDKLPDAPNEMYTILGVPAIELYEDLFAHLCGPRVRDKISHGEKYLDNIPGNLINILMNLTLYTIIKARSHFKDAKGFSTNVKMVDELNLTFENYQSVFHPNSRLKYKLLDTYKEILDLSDIPKPEYEKVETIEVQFDGKSFKETEDWLKNCNFSTFLRQMKVPTLTRPKEESKFVKKVTKIVNTVSEICQQIINHAKVRFELFTNKILGSRQRERYPEILQSILIVQDALRGISNISLYLIHTQFQSNSDELLANGKIFKFLKTTNTYVDKVFRFSDVKYNKWETVRHLTDIYNNQIVLFINTFS